ncbi:MAG TPA: GNAT family N-acetyltransferase [Gaiellaceae bacterium]
MTSLSARLITDIEELAGLSEPWRELAHACSCPAALPGWQLAWWRHVAPEGSLLRAVAVFEGEALVGIATFFVNPGQRVDYRLLGAPITHRISPLAAPGREREVAALVAQTLASSSPRPDLIAFEGVDAASPWPQIFVESWPGRFRPWSYVSSIHTAPVLELGGGFEEWLAARSGNFRRQVARAHRQLEAESGSITLALDPKVIKRATEAFGDLHFRRWERRGGSGLGRSVPAFLEDAAADLVGRGEMRLWVVELDGEPLCVSAFLVAGGEVYFFNSGFGGSRGDLKPGVLALFTAVEDAFTRGEHRFDLGGGAHSYKLRFTTDNAPVCWTGLVPRTRRYFLTRMRLVPDQTHWLVARIGRRLPPAWRRRIKRLMRRS